MNDLIEQDKNTDIAIPQDQGLNPLVAAVLGGADIDPEKLDKLLAVQERYEANEAKKAYSQAMSAFRLSVPTIEKNKRVKYSNTEYKHATLGYAMSVVNPCLGEHGLNPSWRTKQDGSTITVTCRLTHSMGHYEEASLSAAPDASGGKNGIQAIGSAVSYLERYTLFAICGLASSDQDDDGSSSDKKPVPKITDEQAMEIHAMIDENSLNKDKFVRWLNKSKNGQSIEDINVNSYPVVMTQINRSIKAHEKANATN